MEKSGYNSTQDIVKDPKNMATPPSDNDKGDSFSSTNAGKTASKSGAYGGAELGSMVGGAVGPPIIGGIVGSLVGEMVGEKAIQDMGLDRKVAGAGNSLAGVIGERNVNKLTRTNPKVGDIVLTAFGYSDQEVCVCCPCLPASQVLLVITLPFFIFNWFKLGIGVYYESSCSYHDTDQTAYNMSSIHPCEYGYHYLVTSSSVWICFLPFWIATLFGNCWRQCCCCLCDPIVLISTIIDFIKRFCCEIGRFNFCEFVWFSQCMFHIVWAVTGLVWLVRLQMFGAMVSVPGWMVPRKALVTVTISVIMDLLVAGSEIFHRMKLHQVRNSSEPTETSPLISGSNVQDRDFYQ